MKKNKIIYWIATGLLTLTMAFSVFNYFANYEMVAGFFVQLGYPVYLVYPLAIAKILGLIAIHSKLSDTLKDWAYAGFFFNTILAATAHIMISDGSQYGAIIAMACTVVSYVYDKKL